MFSFVLRQFCDTKVEWHLYRIHDDERNTCTQCVYPNTANQECRKSKWEGKTMFFFQLSDCEKSSLAAK